MDEHAVTSALSEPGSVLLCFGSRDTLTDEPDALPRLVSAAEVARAARFRFDRDRNTFLIGRALVRQVLAPLLAKPAAAIELVDASGEKPWCDAARQRHLDFNVSHSQTLVMVGFSHGSWIGVDVEKGPRQSTVDAVTRRLAPEEQEALSQLSALERQAAFLRCWTRKEAVMKALGLGFRLGLSRFAVSVGERPCALLRRPPPDAEAVLPGARGEPSWQLFDVPAPGDYAAAVALTLPACRVALAHVTRISGGLGGHIAAFEPP